MRDDSSKSKTRNEQYGLCCAAASRPPVDHSPFVHGCPHLSCSRVWKRPVALRRDPRFQNKETNRRWLAAFDVMIAVYRAARAAQSSLLWSYQIMISKGPCY